MVLPPPDLLIRSRLIANTGFGPTSSAVGMREPVTITRSTSAVSPGGAAACCANAFAMKITEKPTVAKTQRARIPKLAKLLISDQGSMAPD